MANDSFACNHYPFMKTSNLDGFKRQILQKHPKSHDFTPRFGPKCNLMDRVEINGNISFFILICTKLNNRGAY